MFFLSNEIINDVLNIVGVICDISRPDEKVCQEIFGHSPFFHLHVHTDGHDGKASVPVRRWSCSTDPTRSSSCRLRPTMFRRAAMGRGGDVLHCPDYVHTYVTLLHESTLTYARAQSTALSHVHTCAKCARVCVCRVVLGACAH